MTITIYELLGLVKDGKAPKEIRYKEYTYFWHTDYGYCRSVINSNWIAFTTDYNIENILNDTVEILEEENKIEKIDLGILNDQKQKNKVFKEKINLLIDEINKLKENK